MTEEAREEEAPERRDMIGKEQTGLEIHHAVFDTCAH